MARTIIIAAIGGAVVVTYSTAPTMRKRLFVN